ncbi:hypothetical protein DESME_12055 [Desulfitobacterium metallireducens DSM 15288]|uniref:Uncharacterized protein n=1 Tax=Desulfitobacterium metallireducens DSM 15288 TaxID=871968 RepID=W0EHG4_9FIRM|nr:hypothetical protein DESME_12055 [Desulfitobacterium metallireducens DSM 15288]
MPVPLSLSIVNLSFLNFLVPTHQAILIQLLGFSLIFKVDDNKAFIG